MYTEKRERKVQKNGLKLWLAASFCLLLLGVLLLVSACSNNYQNPGSPNSTPTNGGYSIIHHTGNVMLVLLVPYR